MKKRLFAFILAALFIVSTVPAVSAANGAGFPDMPDETYWSYDALVSAVENGLLKGSGGNLNPKSNLTRAQMAAIVNRAFGAEAKSDISGFSDVAKNDWFFEDVAKAVRMGTFTGTGGGKMSPNNPISREQAFTVVARALKLEGGDESVLSRFSDAGDISLYARGPIAAMAAAGYVNGSGGKVNPRSTITREEFAQVFHNVIKKYVRTAGTATGGVDGNVIVNVPGVTLKGMKIDGDLIVGEGVGNGEIVLDSVTVTGRVVVRGGGVNSVIIRNGTDVGSIVIGKTGDGGVRVRTEEGCHVEIVVIDDGLDTVILEGEYNQVRIDSDVEVVLRDADIVGLTVTAEGANVSLEGDTSVVSAMITDDAKNSVLSVGGDSSVRTLGSYGDGATVSGDGAITSADVSGDGTEFNVSGTQLYVEKGTKGVTENGNAVAGGASVYTGGEQPHVHSWIGGTETPATCTEPGKKVYTCSCGETMEKEIPALGHEWGEGVITKEPTEQEDGVETFTCLRCGTSRTEPVSFLAFAVELPEGGFALFRTLCEAIEEASKYEHHNSPDEPEWTEYAVIHQFNPVTINDITIPAGHTLMVGSDLRLTGDLNLGTSDYSYCPGMGTGRIMVELSEYTSLTIDGFTIYDGDDIESGVIRSSGDGEEAMEMISICGMRAVDKADDPDDVSIYGRPWFVLESAWGEDHEYEIINDFNVSRFFDGFIIEDNAGRVTVLKDLASDGGVLAGEGSELVFRGDDASFTMNGETYVGTGEGAAFRVTDRGGAEDWCVFRGNLTYITAKAATAGAGFTVGDTAFCPAGEDEFVITVARENEMLFLSGIEVRPGVRIVNEGLLTVTDHDVRIGGTFENRGVLNVAAGEKSVSWDQTSRIEFTEGSVLINEGVITVDSIEDEDGYRPSSLNLNKATFENRSEGLLGNSGEVWIEDGTVTNDGEIVSGVITNVGEGQEGPLPNFRMIGTLIENRGRVVNNGNMELDYSDYVQTADAKFETYNAGGLRVFAGSLTVPSGAEFRNEGYMNVVDRYRDGQTDVCDLSGFEDFFTVWNVEGNDSHWCDFEADVYDKDGYFAAVAAQLGKADNEKYNRLDFLGDVTFDGDVVFGEFDHYWVNASWKTMPVIWTDDGPVPVGEGEEFEDYADFVVPVTLTVASGATLTVGGERTLHAVGNGFGDEGASGIIKVEGTLVTAARIDEVWDDGEFVSPGFGEGRVEIWTEGSFDAGEGTVVNDGYFEVRYMEERDDDGNYLGSFSRPGFTTVTGAPDNAAYAAEVRSAGGFLNALSSEDPVFTRLLVREDDTIALTEDVTIPSGTNVDIEGASGFIVEHGATLTVEEGAFFGNSGDVSIYGDLVIEGTFENYQSLEIGALTGSEKATVTVRGYLRNHDRIDVYPTGRIVIDGGSVENHGEMIDATVTDAGVRDSFSGVRFTEPLTISGLNGDKWVHFHECSFCGDITVIAAENEDNLNVSFSECEFSDGLTVTVRLTGDTDCGYNAARLNFGGGETWYDLAPHIFGLGDDPGVFIGVCDEAVSYELTLDGEPLPHTTELIPENEKTHFWSDGHGWFAAGQGNAPDLALTVYMPGLPTVVFERVPLKPEWTFGN